jgi:hypothetical protein
MKKKAKGHHPIIKFMKNNTFRSPPKIQTSNTSKIVHTRARFSSASIYMTDISLRKRENKNVRIPGGGWRSVLVSRARSTLSAPPLRPRRLPVQPRMAHRRVRQPWHAREA